jgi:hypothetical protein|uniref:Uncharacterized protein n=1 Tax=Oryza glumipatula TaxID=40148 RepID=A0A0E0BBR6_9ORYZ
MFSIWIWRPLLVDLQGFQCEVIAWRTHERTRNGTSLPVIFVQMLVSKVTLAEYPRVKRRPCDHK